MNIQEENYTIERHDMSKDKSLKAWSAADEYLLESYHDLESKAKHLAIYNDRFGYLTCHLHKEEPINVLTHKSQEKAIHANLQANGVSLSDFSNPLDSLENKIDHALIKVPKSLGLFKLFLEHISKNSTDDVTVVCSFMTRHFSPRLLEIASEYFEVVTQSKALKKARLISLSKKKASKERTIMRSIQFNGEEYKQYLGVFSAERIDTATQFFLENIQIRDEDQTVLDMASGNGVIAKEIYKQIPHAEMHLMDDSYLAVSSAALNINGEQIHHHYNNNLSDFADNQFDLIASNPPFHIEYEVNVQITLDLFKNCVRCLKEGGNLQVVANKHLNYKVHLDPIFTSVQVIAENKKFIVYKCIK